MKYVIFVALLASAWAAPTEVSILDSNTNVKMVSEVIKEYVESLDAYTALTILRHHKSAFFTSVHNYIAALPHKSKDSALSQFASDSKSDVLQEMSTPFLFDIQTAPQLYQALIESIRKFLSESQKVSKGIKKASSEADEKIDDYLREAAQIAVRTVQNLKTALETILNGATSSSN